LGYDEAAVQELVGVRKKMDRIDEDLRERSHEHPDDIALARPEDIETYARWAPEVGRYSFHWNLE
jgi:hypothetical protein